MAEFKDNSLWMKLAFLLITLGFLIFLFSIGYGGSSWRHSAEGCFIVGFLCFLVAVILGLCLMFLDEVKGNKAAQICFIIFALLAGEY